ncbi:MAG: UTP--glucose-1-phosphate uridylyltransferase GalU, partial [Dehalococcoidia bacterium]|nr:UTP--glucose-1-phosphate uridylyltransferase GalU [Dehalococcoidia bacterium]
MRVRKAVIPAAGLGTRFLPTSKSVPKELLPILDKPMIQYGIEEAVAAGLELIVVVTSPGKETLESYFSKDPALERHLMDSSSQELLDKVRHVSSLAEMSFVIQKRPLGLGHAVLTAKDRVGDERFLLILPDDVIWDTEGASRQMLRVFEKYGSSVVAVEEVPLEAVRNYGVVDSSLIGEGVHRVNGLVEKPNPTDAPSNLAIVGRYILTPEIFECLGRTTPGAKGEIQITDGMALLLERQPMYAYLFRGDRYDAGTPLGFLKASVGIGLKREDTRLQVLGVLNG